MDSKKAIALIEQHGIFGLDEYDGCLCCNFEVAGVSVSVSCHKSEHCVRVWSHHLCRCAKELEQVMVAVLSSLAKERQHPVDDYRIRFCEYSADHPDGQNKCCFCGATREEPDGYLCGKCAQNPDAAALYPWTKDGLCFVSPLSSDGRAVPS